MCKFWQSTIGKKSVMAVTGLILIGFVVMHMIGNLKVFMGIDAISGQYKIDVYGEFLRSMGYPIFSHGEALWIARIILIGAVLLHILSAVQLTLISRAARPVGYAKVQPDASTYAARTMRVGGVIVLFYIVYHLMHLTLGYISAAPYVAGHVYGNVYGGFKVWYIATFYIVAIGMLALHLYHGVWSLVQTLGLSNPGWNGLVKMVARLLAIIVFVGYVSVPVAVIAGVLPAPVDPYPHGIDGR